MGLGIAEGVLRVGELGHQRVELLLEGLLANPALEALGLAGVLELFHLGANVK